MLKGLLMGSRCELFELEQGSAAVYAFCCEPRRRMQVIA
jgi:hypothetical protein